MRLICPNCDAQYEVEDGAIPPAGRDVQCSNCGHGWFHVPADPILEEAVGTAAAPAAKAPPPAPVAPPAPVPSPAAAVTDAGDDDGGGAPAAAGVGPAQPVRRAIDENLLAILREEAAREAAVRKAEATRAIETQPDLGLPESGRRPPEPPAPPAPPAAPPPAPDPESEPDRPVTERPTTRRSLLPDIEEINSTLRPGTEARDDEGLPEPVPAPRQGSFRTGFLSVIILAAVLVILYVMAPQLAARFPSLAGALTAYAAAVDALRLWVDELMQSAAGGLRGLTGED